MHNVEVKARTGAISLTFLWLRQIAEPKIVSSDEEATIFRVDIDAPTREKAIEMVRDKINGIRWGLEYVA